jgi:uncharacterized membrane protein YdjX (TVP38/TMEM64 family)
MNKLTTILIAVTGITVSLFTAFMRGKSAGKQATEAKHNEQQLEAIKELQQRIHKAGDVSGDDVRDSLRKGDF